MSLRALLAIVAVSLAAVLVPTGASAERAMPGVAGEVAYAQLPREARETIERIRHGGPFPYARDGAVFSNREGALPRHPRGYYHEYTVKTPGVRSRGARRIVWGARGEFYYTDDHYNTFRRVRD